MLDEDDVDMSERMDVTSSRQQSSFATHAVLSPTSSQSQFREVTHIVNIAKGGQVTNGLETSPMLPGSTTDEFHSVSSVPTQLVSSQGAEERAQSIVPT